MQCDTVLQLGILVYIRTACLWWLCVGIVRRAWRSILRLRLSRPTLREALKTSISTYDQCCRPMLLLTGCSCALLVVCIEYDADKNVNPCSRLSTTRGPCLCNISWIQINWFKQYHAQLHTLKKQKKPVWRFMDNNEHCSRYLTINRKN